MVELPRVVYETCEFRVVQVSNSFFSFERLARDAMGAAFWKCGFNIHASGEGPVTGKELWLVGWCLQLAQEANDAARL